MLPGESSLIVAGLLTQVGDLQVAPVIAAGALGAFVGDNTMYWLGRKVGRPVQQRLFKGERSVRLIGWAEKQLDERGAVIVLVSRFIPGGRSATTFSAGLVRFSWPRFLLLTAIAGVLWSTYATLVGMVGGVSSRPSLAGPGGRVHARARDRRRRRGRSPAQITSLSSKTITTIVSTNMINTVKPTAAPPSASFTGALP